MMKKEDLTPHDRPTITRHTVLNKPKYAPDAHLQRRDDDKEELERLLLDLIRTEIKNYFKK